MSSRASQLNLECACESVGDDGLAKFYARAPLFVDAEQVRRMNELVGAIHRVVALPGFQRGVLAEAPPIARIEPRALGVFCGFDFHVGALGPSLIEINTNAGGAMLNAAANWRYPECCDAGNPGIKVSAARARLESDFLAMFRNEWHLARGEQPLRTIAIVDARPAEQFLLPEFRLFAELFESQGIEALIVDAADLVFSAGKLRTADRVVDLVYNRLTDFYFDEPANAALRAAYLADATVITPHPRAHALFADKRNLVRLTDAAFLASIGVVETDRALLQAGIPLTRGVDGSADDWWRDRAAWFFKPVHGFGSRGAYRGDKITRRVFGEIVRGGYVAQEIAPPGERLRAGPEGAQQLKVDLRLYVYAGITQLMAARLYQGQTTNFRTAGGGFAPVIELLDV